jgi:hypothetical protein
LHLDLKPSNVLVSAQGRVVVLDFGLSSTKGDDLRGVIAGTPGYMSPERLDGKPVSEAADWYSVGVMLYRALTGRKRFHRDSPAAPSTLVRDVPEDLDSLCIALLRQNPEERPDGREILRRLGAEEPTESGLAAERVFVGREAQLETLRRAFAEEHAACCVVQGKSGIGKSALVHRFLGELRGRDDCLVLVGRCYEQEFARYQALDSVVDELSQHLATLPPAELLAVMPGDAPLLAMLFPVLKDLAGPVITALPPEQRELRARAFECMRQLFANLSARRRVVVFIDDVHWADADSVPLLSHLTRGPAAPAVLWIFCRRTVGQTPWSAGDGPVQTETKPIEIAVDEFSPSEALDLAKSLAPQRADAVAHESGGNPLVLWELARHNDAVFEQRIAALEDPARLILEIAAVAARPVARIIARRAAELAGAESAVLAQLRGARLLHTREIELYHDRVRTAVMNRLTPGAIRDRHQRLAWALEESGHADPELLMIHFQGAGNPDKTARYAIAAGDRSTAALAFHSAAGFYRVALETGALERSRALEVRVHLADSLANAGRGAEAAEVYESAATEQEDRDSRVELQRRAASQFLMSGRPARGLELTRQVLHSVGLDAPCSPRRALWRVARQRLAIWSRGYSWKERDAAAIDGRELLRIDVCYSVAQGLGMMDMIQATAYQGTHLLLALRAGEPYRVARALCVEAGYFAAAGRAGEDRAEALLVEAMAIASRTGNPHALGLATLVSGMAALLAGRWKRSRDIMAQAEQVLRERCVGVAWELATARLFHSVALFFLGELRELGERLPALLESADERGDIYEATDLRIRIAHAALLAQDRVAEARAAAERAAEDWPRDRFYIQHWWSLMARTEIHLYAGEPEAAWQLIDNAWPALRRSLLLRVQYIRVESLYHRACAGIMAGHPAGRRQAVQDAAKLRREDADWAVALAHAVEAGLAPDRQRAVWLERAHDGFECAGMALFATAARWHLDGAEDRIRSQGVRNPAAMASMLIPPAADR